MQGERYKPPPSELRFEKDQGDPPEINTKTISQMIKETREVKTILVWWTAQGKKIPKIKKQKIKIHHIIIPSKSTDPYNQCLSNYQSIIINI